MAFWNRKKSAMPDSVLSRFRAWPGFDLYAPTALGLYSGAQQDYADIYKTQPAVRIVVDFLARNIAGLGLHAFERVTTTDRERIVSGPLVDVLDHPHPKITPYRLWRGIVSDVAIYDNAYLLKVRDKARSDFGFYLQPLPPKYVGIKGGNVLEAAGYWLYNAAGDKQELDPEAVIHFHGYNPLDPRIGLSAMETLRRVLAEDYAMQEYREFFWKNGARPGGVITRPGGDQAVEWTEQERELFRTMWETAYSGSLGSGRTAILEDGMEYKPLAFNSQQSQYIEARKLSREEVASAYGIAPTLVGILDHATFSNIESQHIQLYQDTLGPWLTMLEQDVELQLVSEFPNVERTYVEFNLSEKLKGSFADQVRSIQTLTGGPVLTRNEGRALLNRPNLGPEYDVVITPLNVTAGGQASPTDSAPPPKDYSETVREVVERQKQVLASRLRPKGIRIDRVFDTERWVKELSDDLTDAMGPTEAVVMAGAIKSLAGVIAEKADPVVNVTVEPAEVNVTVPREQPRATVKRIERDEGGNLLRIVTEEGAA